MALSYGFVGQVITRWTVEMRYLAWAPTNGPYMWIRYTLITQGQICHLSNANHGRDLNIELFKNPPSLFPMKEAKQDRNSEIEFRFFRVSINPRFHLYVPISQCFLFLEVIGCDLGQERWGGWWRTSRIWWRSSRFGLCTGPSASSSSLTSCLVSCSAFKFFCCSWFLLIILCCFFRMLISRADCSCWFFMASFNEIDFLIANPS